MEIRALEPHDEMQRLRFPVKYSQRRHIHSIDAILLWRLHVDTDDTQRGVNLTVNNLIHGWQVMNRIQGRLLSWLAQFEEHPTAVLITVAADDLSLLLSLCRISTI